MIPSHPPSPGGRFPDRPVRPPKPPRHGPPQSPHSSPAWERELNKMIGREVTITQYIGTNRDGVPLYLDQTGICIALQHTFLSVVLMTDDEKQVFRNVLSIRRKRSKNNPPKAEPTVADLANVLDQSLKGAPE